MFDPRSGWTFTRRWKGSDAALVDIATAEGLLGNRFVVTPADDGGDSILESTSIDEAQSPTEPLSDTWDLDGNDLEKELWELPWVRDVFDSIRDDKTGNPTDSPLLVSNACINWIRKAIESFIRGDDKIKFVDGVESPFTYAYLIQSIDMLGGHGTDILYRLIAMYARGVKSFPVAQFVLKRTRVVADNYSEKAEYDDIFKRRTTESLKAAYGIPATLIYFIPEGEWIKKTPSMKKTGVRKWTLTEEWWHADKWEVEIYGELI